jgi:hypothetical protein
MEQVEVSKHPNWLWRPLRLPSSLQKVEPQSRRYTLIGLAYRSPHARIKPRQAPGRLQHLLAHGPSSLAKSRPHLRPSVPLVSLRSSVASPAVAPAAMVGTFSAHSVCDKSPRFSNGWEQRSSPHLPPDALALAISHHHWKDRPSAYLATRFLVVVFLARFPRVMSPSHMRTEKAGSWKSDDSLPRPRPAMPSMLSIERARQRGTRPD